MTDSTSEKVKDEERTNPLDLETKLELNIKWKVDVNLLSPGGVQTLRRYVEGRAGED
jgi:hypothetical protein